MTQDEVEAAIRAEWDRLSRAEKSDKARVQAFCERMASRYEFRNGNSRAAIQDWVRRWQRSVRSEPQEARASSS